MADASGAVRRTPRPARGEDRQTPEIGGQDGRGATITGGPVSSDQDAVSSAVSSQARDELILVIAHPAGGERNLGPRPWECGPCERAERIADQLLAAGWRPLPAWQWGYRLDVQPADFAVEASEATARLNADEPGTVLVRRPVGEWEVVSRG